MYEYIPDFEMSADKLYITDPIRVLKLQTNQLNKIIDQVANNKFERGDVLFFDSSHFIGLDSLLETMRKVECPAKVAIYERVDIQHRYLFLKKTNAVLMSGTCSLRPYAEEPVYGLPWNSYQVQKEIFYLNKEKEKNRVTFVIDNHHSKFPNVKETPLDKLIDCIEKAIDQTADRNLVYSIFIIESYKDPSDYVYTEFCNRLLNKEGLNITVEIGNENQHKVYSAISTLMIYPSSQSSPYFILEALTLGAHVLLNAYSSSKSVIDDYPYSGMSRISVDTSQSASILATKIINFLKIKFNPINNNCIEWHNHSADRIAGSLKALSQK